MRLPLTSSVETRACCAAFYGSQAVAWLMGGSLHPGGDRLTRRLLQMVGVDATAQVLDVAAGRGETSILAAQEVGCSVIGLDYGREGLTAARDHARKQGLQGTLRLLQGDAEALPLRDASVDTVLCECSLCLFPDKALALQEMFRVLRPGGRLGLADLVLLQGPLPPELQGMAAYVTCLGAMESPDGYRRLIEQAGFSDLHWEDHREALVEYLDGIRQRLAFARLLAGPDKLPIPGVDWDQINRILDAAQRLVERGDASYVLLAARKG